MKGKLNQLQHQIAGAVRPSLWLSVLLLGAGTALADTVLWSEGFEAYNTDAGQIWGGLDKNLAGSPNAAANGVGNPWFGPSPNNGWITKATANPLPVQVTVTPHSGQFMMRGGRNSGGWYNGYDGDIDHVNIGYRFNNGAAFKSNFSMRWYFYDAIGNNNVGNPDSGPGNFGDYAALEYAAAAPTATDYVNNGNLGAVTATLALGAYETGSGYNVSVYQAQVQGAGGDFGDGWFNTSLTRSVGWHDALISVDGNGIATFSIDGTVVLTHATGAANGFNVFTTRELWNTPDTYNQSAYYDDLTLSQIPEPGSLTLLGLGLIGFLAWGRRQRQ